MRGGEKKEGYKKKRKEKETISEEKEQEQKIALRRTDNLKVTKKKRNMYR